MRKKRTCNRLPSRMTLTTGNVAKMLDVSTNSVNKWADKGIIKYWRIPGSEGRRFLLSDVALFIKERGIPFAVLGDHPLRRVIGMALRLRLLIISPDPFLSELANLMADWDVDVTDSVFKAGIIAADNHPSVLVLDAITGKTECLKIADHIAGLYPPLPPAVLFLANEDDDQTSDIESKGVKVLIKPISSSQVMETVKQISSKIFNPHS